MKSTDKDHLKWWILNLSLLSRGSSFCVASKDMEKISFISVVGIEWQQKPFIQMRACLEVTAYKRSCYLHGKNMLSLSWTKTVPNSMTYLKSYKSPYVYSIPKDF